MNSARVSFTLARRLTDEELAALQKLGRVTFVDETHPGGDVLPLVRVDCKDGPKAGPAIERVAKAHAREGVLPVYLTVETGFVGFEVDAGEAS